MKIASGVAGAALVLNLGIAVAQETPAAEAPAATPAQAPVPEAPAETSSEAPGTVQYIGVLGTFGDPDKDRSVNGADIDYSGGFSLLYGRQTPANWGFEIQGFGETLETEKPLRTDFYRYGLNADVFYAFGDRTRFTPFVLIGIGGNYNDVFPADDQTDFFANGGVGFVTAPVVKSWQLRLRGEVRFIYDTFESSYGDIRYALGFEIPVFAPQPPPPPPPPAPQVVEVVNEQTVTVPTGLTDSDGDGVVDSADKCPGTPAGTRVDGEGCPLEKIIELKGVTFEFNKTRLRPDALTILDGAVPTLKKYPEMKVEVAGHTDNIGSDAYNQKLSEGRANAVRDHFVQQGVPESQLTVKGYGESEPVADNATEEGRERNRRTELRILN
jgi:OOP family OmpA-OmpF porin